MKYCIYCGAKLPEATPPTIKPPQPVTLPPLPPTIPPPVQSSQSGTPSPQPVVPKDEITSLMSGIEALYERKISLLDLYRSGEISERVFLKLYNEYESKLSSFLKARETKVEELKGKLEERSKRLSEISMKLEELEVRRKVGEVDSNLYTQQADSLRAEERQLVMSSKALESSISSLESLLVGKRPSQIRDFENKLKACLSDFEKLVAEGKVSEETLKAVKPDINETIAFMDLLIKEHKERDRNLREQLETLQTRYKLSELSVEEYERRKRELQTEIDKIWA
jgi:chromosome segregation ATPase